MTPVLCFACSMGPVTWLVLYLWLYLSLATAGALLVLVAVSERGQSIARETHPLRVK